MQAELLQMSRLSRFVLGTLFALGARLVAAQDVADSVQLHNDCRLAAQVLTTGNPDPLRSWALQTIQSCDVEAGAAIPAVWQSPLSTAEDLGSLVAASIANRDARILDAVMTVATNAGAAPELRIASLRVLASYGDRRVWVSLEDLQSRRALILPFTDHPIGREGNNPLPVDIRARVLAVLNGLAQGDPNDSIRDAARFLVKAFPLP